jgi:hypothetical protein
MDIFSEYILLFVLYTMMLFSDFVPEIDMRFNIGYASIAIVSLHLFVNLILILVSVGRKIVLKIKNWYIRIKHNRAIKEKKN